MGNAGATFWPGRRMCGIQKDSSFTVILMGGFFWKASISSPKWRFLLGNKAKLLFGFLARLHVPFDGWILVWSSLNFSTADVQIQKASTSTYSIYISSLHAHWLCPLCEMLRCRSDKHCKPRIHSDYTGSALPLVMRSSVWPSLDFPCPWRVKRMLSHILHLTQSVSSKTWHAESETHSAYITFCSPYALLYTDGTTFISPLTFSFTCTEYNTSANTDQSPMRVLVVILKFQWVFLILTHCSHFPYQQCLCAGCTSY